MNHFVWPTIVLGVIAFLAGSHLDEKLKVRSSRTAVVIVCVVCALPGVSFAAYYTKLLGEPIWLYRFRAVPGTELAAAGMGLLAGYIHHARLKHPILRRQLRAFTAPTLLAIALFAPYVKPIIRPLRLDPAAERWENGVCLQSTASTCGPASAATILRTLGGHASEFELARDSYTYAGGTENWYLARAIRGRGHNVEFTKLQISSDEIPTQAVAGVKLDHGSGHFISVIGRNGETFTVADPLSGKFAATQGELRQQYRFTGFFLLIK